MRKEKGFYCREEGVKSGFHLHIYASCTARDIPKSSRTHLDSRPSFPKSAQVNLLVYPQQL